MTLGFVDNSQVSVGGAVAGAVANAVTWVVGTTVQTVSAVVNAIQSQTPQQSTQTAGVTGTIAFEPWGPDPYEEEQVAPGPADPVVFPPPAPVPEHRTRWPAPTCSYPSGRSSWVDACLCQE